MNTTVVNVPSANISPALNQILNKVLDLFPYIVNGIKETFDVLRIVALVLSIFFFFVIIYCVERLKQIRVKEAEKHDAKVVPAFEQLKNEGDMALAKRWEGIKKHIESDNQNDWRQAIMDADIILDDLLNKMGYRGESVGEKLKRAEKGDFATLDEAWEAHKIRNQIAHEGATFSLNHHEAKKAFGHYRKVFEEFYYV